MTQSKWIIAFLTVIALGSLTSCLFKKTAAPASFSGAPQGSAAGTEFFPTISR